MTKIKLLRWCSGLSLFVFLFLPLSVTAEETTEYNINSFEFNFGSFAPWQENEGNVEGGYSHVKDPSGESDVLVELFTIKPGQCAAGDCNNNSSRWEKVENVYDYPTNGSRAQPSEAWYGWEMFLPDEFAYGRQQAKGPILMGQFKENNGRGCPHLALWHHTRGNDAYDLVIQKNLDGPPPNDCKAMYARPLSRIKSMLGKWSRVELRVKWSLGDDGEIDAFFNSRQVIKYRGPTCYVNCDEFNNFRYGVYFANQREKETRPVTVAYRNVRRANSRELLWQ
jgi:hypothetical protein